MVVYCSTPLIYDIKNIYTYCFQIYFVIKYFNYNESLFLIVGKEIVVKSWNLYFFCYAVCWYLIVCSGLLLASNILRTWSGWSFRAMWDGLRILNLLRFLLLSTLCWILEVIGFWLVLPLFSVYYWYSTFLKLSRILFETLFATIEMLSCFWLSESLKVVGW